MKIRCKIFGHKFVQFNYYDRETQQYIPKRYNFCLRCGDDRIKNSNYEVFEVKNTKSTGTNN
jgi:hypothetical protein